MTDSRDICLKALYNFLKENENILKQPESLNFLGSIKLPSVNLNAENLLSLLIQKNDRLFFFENPDKKFSMLGIGLVLDFSENGLGRLSSLNKKIQDLKRKVISNWKGDENQLPLICGTMKFTAEHSKEEWQDFYDSDWFVPEFIFVKTSEEEYFVYNFLNKNSSQKKIEDKFNLRLKELFELTPTQENKTFKILNIQGGSAKDKKKWKILVKNTIDKLTEQDISKLVLSRRVILKLTDQPDWDSLLKYFRSNYPTSYIYLYHKNNSTFFGASPERLIKFHQKEITIDVIAGSLPRGTNEHEEKLLEEQMSLSKKLNTEHELVLHQVKKSISRFVSKIYSNRVPFKKLKEVQHLHTVLKSEMLAEAKMLEIVESIFPTAAVCGEPKDKSLGLIKKIEDYNRGLYSGLIGYFNFDDEGEFIVAIRSALYNQKKLYAYAGVGILKESDPEIEYNETELKLKTILNFFDEKSK